MPGEPGFGTSRRGGPVALAVLAGLAGLTFAAASTESVAQERGAQKNGAQSLSPFVDAISAPLEGRTGDPDRGRAIVLDRRIGNCLICHQVPVEGEPFQGDLGPDLRGIGGRLTAGQLRFRLIDQSVLNPATLMPPYFRTSNLTRVAQRYQGQPVLTAQQVEDVVAWLSTLR